MTDNGVRFLALNREEAKQVFSKKASPELYALIDTLLGDDERLTNQRNLQLGENAAAYAALIESQSALDVSAKSLLTRGGRILPSSPGAEIYLLRPDMIGPLSLSAISIERLGPFLSGAASRSEAVVIVY